MNKKRKQNLKLGLALAAVAALIFWMTTRWDVWFHNPEEQPQQLSRTPHNVMLTFGNDGELSRNVSWQCDSVLQPSCLRLVCLADSDTTTVEATGEVFRSRNGQAAYYVARLTALRPATSYAYQVATAGKASPWYAFTTQEDNLQSASFLYVGDVQDTLGGQANHFLREALQHHPRSQFLVCGGDLTERPTNQHWTETFRDLDSVAQHMPVLAVTGNHDYLKGIIMRLERRFSLVFSYFLNSMVGENQVYTCCYGPAQFFLLDSNRELPYLLTQRSWLRQQLEQSTARWKIVVLHHPLYSIKGMNNLIQRWAFNDLIQDYGVDLVLQGHEHAYARMTHHDHNGTPTTPVYTVSHCSPKNYRIHFDDRFDKFGISSRYYQTIDIVADTLTLCAYEVYSHTLYDSLRIVKQGQGAPALIEDRGRQIPEYMEYEPNPDSKKDRDYARRIADYRQRHPERMAAR